MHIFTVKKDSRPFWHLDGDSFRNVIVRSRSFIINLILSLLISSFLHEVSNRDIFPQSFYSPHTPILNCCIINSNPYPSYSIRSGYLINSILMRDRFSSNFRVFDNVHCLNNSWGFIPENFSTNFLHFI